MAACSAISADRASRSDSFSRSRASSAASDVLLLLNLGQGRVEQRGPLDGEPLLLGLVLPGGGQLGPQPLGFAEPDVQLGLGRVESAAVGGELGGLLPRLLVLAVEPGADDGQHRLLRFELRGAAGEAVRLPLQIGSQPLQPGGLGPQPVLFGPGQSDLFLQFGGVAPELLEPLVHLGRARSSVELSVRERRLPAVEPDDVGGVAVAVGLQRLAVDLKLFFPARDFDLPARDGEHSSDGSRLANSARSRAASASAAASWSAWPASSRAVRSA